MSRCDRPQSLWRSTMRRNQGERGRLKSFGILLQTPGADHRDAPHAPQLPQPCQRACALTPDRPRLSTTQLEAKMPGTVEKKLVDLGITLGTPAAPVANYVGFVRTGNLLVVSGQLCFGSDGTLAAVGKLGGAVSIEDGQKAARACAINLLSQI